MPDRMPLHKRAWEPTHEGKCAMEQMQLRMALAWLHLYYSDMAKGTAQTIDATLINISRSGVLTWYLDLTSRPFLTIAR